MLMHYTLEKWHERLGEKLQKKDLYAQITFDYQQRFKAEILWQLKLNAASEKEAKIIEFVKNKV